VGILTHLDAADKKETGETPAASNTKSVQLSLSLWFSYTATER